LTPSASAGLAGFIGPLTSEDQAIYDVLYNGGLGPVGSAAEFNVSYPWYIDAASIGADALSVMLTAGDILGFGPSGEGIGPALALQGGITTLKSKARRDFFKQLNKAALRGIRKHQAWNPGRGFVKEFTIRGVGRADAIDLKRFIIKELKPNNPLARALGNRQLSRYIRGLERQFPESRGKWKGILETYD
jgi:hypothetical protein